MESKDVRWQQRFSNYKKALTKLEEAVHLASQQELSELEKEGLVQRFEYTYELAWKTIQDFLRYKGYTAIAGPSPVLAQAFQDGYITDNAGWVAMHRARGLSSHTYNRDMADEIVEAITITYQPLLSQLARQLEEELYGPQLNLFDQ